MFIELKKLRNTNIVNIADEINEIESEFSQTNVEDETKWSVIRVIRRKEFVLPLLLVCALQAGQQLSGINSVSNLIKPVWFRPWWQGQFVFRFQYDPKYLKNCMTS